MSDLRSLTRRGSSPERVLALCAVAVLAFALLYRLWPLVGDAEALRRFFITEDGYLLLTVARNIAIGNGLSVSAGEIATNGVQPLATFLFAIPYWITEGDKTASLVGVVAISAAVAAAGAWAVRRFAAAALRPQDPSPLWPLLVAALWFAGPLLLLHTMNGLETGLYTLAVLAALGLFARLVSTRARFSWSDRIALGVVLGLTFLARVDAVFLIAAILLVLFARRLAERDLRAALLDTVPPGLVSILTAAPWLIYNLALFGSVIPISGQAQSLSAGFGSNAGRAPAELFETMFPMLPVPGALEEVLPLNLALGAVAVLILGLFLVRAARRRDPFRLAIFAYALHATLLVGYYALFFGAPHFLSRYFAPLAPLLIVAAVSVGLDLAARLAPARGRALAAAGGAGALALSALLLLRLLLPGVHVQGHFQVVEWVERNVPEAAWVGAVQTGTLGYWHDRTINLDGKVNPEALRARIEQGHVLDYVTRSRIDYLADWPGIAGWVEQPAAAGGFAKAFEVVALAPERNLAALRRRTARPGDAS
jgi:hypothetical protein